MYYDFLEGLNISSPYFDKSLDLARQVLSKSWFQRNTQSRHIFGHFGDPFVGSPRLEPVQMDYMIPTELLDFVVSNLLAFKAPISDFLEKICILPLPPKFLIS